MSILPRPIRVSAKPMLLFAVLFLLLAALTELVQGAVVPVAQEQQAQQAQQEDAADQEENLATVRGKIEWTDDSIAFDLSEFKPVMEEQVQLKPFPLPVNWAEMQLEERQAWMSEFQDSAAGKELIAQRQQQFEQRLIFDLEVDDEGEFTLFDVPSRTYGIRARVDKEVDGKTFAIEVFGQVAVGEVDEVQLKPLPIVITRLVQPGELADDIRGDVLGKTETGSLAEARREQWVLVTFWNSQFEPSQADLLQLNQLFADGKLGDKVACLGVCLDENKDRAAQFVKENEIAWTNLCSPGWDSDAASNFGVRSLPSYWLIDQTGKVRVTNGMFFQLIRSGKFNLESVVFEAVAGTDLQAVIQQMQTEAQQTSDDK